MKKLVGLLAFGAALVGAILLTQYYSRRYAPPPPPPPPAAPAPPVTGAGVVTTAPSSSSYTDARGNAPVTFKTQLVKLDLAAKKVGSSRVDLQACKLEYSIVSPK